eukprot:TRINITY_DN471_c4_g1_i1.p1 TRINITY_DN471_c4_g1~~TRINITY_DN471_c4_g1_i1.p1  ORF type:complete len:216 (-),score=-19.01 TRINITY_DN471_c4_g1_i1:596-1243(-)
MCDIMCDTIGGVVFYWTVKSIHILCGVFYVLYYFKFILVYFDFFALQNLKCFLTTYIRQMACNFYVVILLHFQLLRIYQVYQYISLLGCSTWCLYNCDYFKYYLNSLSFFQLAIIYCILGTKYVWIFLIKCLILTFHMFYFVSGKLNKVGLQLQRQFCMQAYTYILFVMIVCMHIHTYSVLFVTGRYIHALLISREVVVFSILYGSCTLLESAFS